MSDEPVTDQDDMKLARVLRAAGPREEPDAAMRGRVYAATLTAFEAMPETRPRERVWYPWAAAAGVALTVLIGLASGVLPTGTAPVAELVHASGGSERPGRWLEAEAEVATGAGELITLELASGVLLTLDAMTRVQVHARDQVSLREGRLYVDAARGRVRLLTPHVQIVDIGTIYQVRSDRSGTEVSMREGMAELAFAAREATLHAADGRGEVLHVGPQGDVLARREVATTASDWHWRNPGRAPLALEGLNVREYLVWLARDTGRTLQFASRAVEQEAAMETLFADANRYADVLELADVLETTSFEVIDVNDYTWRVDVSR